MALIYRWVRPLRDFMWKVLERPLLAARADAHYNEALRGKPRGIDRKIADDRLMSPVDGLGEATVADR